MGQLTPKQEMFIKEYLVDLNATQAAIRAGYSKKTARFIGEENLTKPNIQKSISEAMQVRSDEVKITSNDVLKYLLEIYHEAREKEDLKSATRSLELVGKHLGMFKDKMELTGTIGLPLQVAVDLRVMSDEQLQALLAQGDSDA